MQVHQNLSILFYRKRKKADKNGYIPIYCRVTIDGLEDEMSTGFKVLNDEWDHANKQVLSDNPNHKAYNKKIGQIRTDLERHFDLVVAKHGIAIPSQVIASYRTPINGHRQRSEEKENIAFSMALDALIADTVKYLRKTESLRKKGVIPPSQIELTKNERNELQQKCEKLVERGRIIWDDKEWNKTLLNSIDEFLCHFLEMVLADERARTTFSKIITTKSRLPEFVTRRYKKEDIPLSALKGSFLRDFTKHNIIYHKNSHNTVWKYVQIAKEVVDRAHSHGWMTTNVFTQF